MENENPFRAGKPRPPKTQGEVAIGSSAVLITKLHRSAELNCAISHPDNGVLGKALNKSDRS